MPVEIDHPVSNHIIHISGFVLFDSLIQQSEILGERKMEELFGSRAKLHRQKVENAYWRLLWQCSSQRRPRDIGGDNPAVIYKLGLAFVVISL